MPPAQALAHAFGTGTRLRSGREGHDVGAGMRRAFLVDDRSVCPRQHGGTALIGWRDAEARRGKIGAVGRVIGEVGQRRVRVRARCENDPRAADERGSRDVIRGSVRGQQLRARESVHATLGRRPVRERHGDLAL